MKNLVIEIFSQTASFRNPSFQNFHKSLDLPPPTTVIGLTGAALGLSPLQAQEFFHKNEINIGVYGLYAGKCNDTWKYNRRTKEMWLYKSELDGSIIQKEYLINARFLIAFSSDNSKIISMLNEAFQNPVYALTMGNSDSLACIKSSVTDLPEVMEQEVENCILEGDVVDNVLSYASEKPEFSIYYTSEHFVYDLPTRFNYVSDYGKRTIAQTATFSMIRNKMKLNYLIECLNYRGILIPLIKVI